MMTNYVLQYLAKAVKSTDILIKRFSKNRFPEKFSKKFIIYWIFLLIPIFRAKFQRTRWPVYNKWPKCANLFMQKMLPTGCEPAPSYVISTTMPFMITGTRPVIWCLCLICKTPSHIQTLWLKFSTTELWYVIDLLFRIFWKKSLDAFIVKFPILEILFLKIFNDD